MKKPMLTSSYLALMNAFQLHSDYVLERDKSHYLDRISLMQEYCTLRIDAGRQTGKTEAIAEFCKDWLADGNDVIVVADRLSYAKSTAARIKLVYENVLRISKDPYRKVIPVTIRDFLGDSYKFRGINLNRVLVIIEEPMRLPEIYKFYKAYEDNISICTLSSGGQIPLFFVMGIQ